MVAIGQRNSLRVIRETASGLYLDGESLGQILLPGRYIPKGCELGSSLSVFVYRDSEDRLVATTETPRAMVGDFASLKVVSVSAQMGAFLDWGLSKDLLLPIREQAHRVMRGQFVVAHVLLDTKTGRLFASTHLNRFLDLSEPPFTEGQAVQLLIVGETPLGYKAIVDNTHWGLLYHSDLSVPLDIGRRLSGYVRLIRPGGKIDLALNPAGYQRVGALTEQIMDALKANHGELEFDDQSSPEAIRAAFGTSKKAFKQALGALFRDRQIAFEKPGIRLLSE